MSAARLPPHRAVAHRPRVGSVLARLTTAATLTLLAACGASPPPPHRVVMLGIDGGDWRILDPFIDAGIAPNLARLRQTGASAALQVDSAQSPESWTSIASGRHPAEHGVIQKNNGQLGGSFGASNADVKVHRIWDMVNRNGRTSFVLNFWATSPAYPILGVLVPRENGRTWPPDLDHAGSDIPPANHPELIHALGLGALQSGWAKQLLEKQSFDLTILPYYGVDQGLHILYNEYATAQNSAAMERLSPAAAERMKLGYALVEETVRLADLWAGIALQAAGPDGYVLLFSDHGHSPATPSTRRIALGRAGLDGRNGSIENGTVDLAALGVGEARATVTDTPHREGPLEVRVPSLRVEGAAAEAAKQALLTHRTEADTPVFALAPDGSLVASPQVVTACIDTLGKHEEPAWSCFVNTGSHGLDDLGIFALVGPDVKPGRLPAPIQSVDITPTTLWLMGLPTGADLAGHPRTELLTVDRPVLTIPTYEDGKMPWRHGAQDAPADPVKLQEWLKSMGYLE